MNNAFSIDQAEWQIDEYKCLNLYVRDIKNRPVHVWIEARPNSCDRGHFKVNIDGILDKNGITSLDQQDGFPRYYMRLKNAVDETVRFLKWRLFESSDKDESYIQFIFGGDQMELFFKLFLEKESNKDG